VNCRQFEQFLDLYLDEELEGTLKLEFEAHMVDCESCGHMFATMEAVGQIIASPTPDEPVLSVDFTDRVMAGLKRQQRKTLRIRTLVGISSVAAAIALVATGVVFFTSHLLPARQDTRTVKLFAMNDTPKKQSPQQLNQWLAGTLERAGTNLMGIGQLRSAAWNQMRQGLFNTLAQPMVPLEGIESFDVKTAEDGPNSKAADLEAGLEML